MRLSFMIIFIAIASLLVIFLLDRIFHRKRYVKYIPILILIPFMIYNFITMHSASNEGFEELGKFIMGIFLLAASLSSLISAVAFDMYHKNKNRIK